MYFKNTVLSLKENPESQRALVLQGGGSLGAYEAGVFYVLYHWIRKDLQENEHIFDVIAGTSIGAINGSIILSKFLENKEDHQIKNYFKEIEEREVERAEEDKTKRVLQYWEGVPERLIEFWKTISITII